MTRSALNGSESFRAWGSSTGLGVMLAGGTCRCAETITRPIRRIPFRLPPGGHLTLSLASDLGGDGEGMSSEKTMAIVIRLVEFSESSYVATIFTEDFGKITGLAKGARRTKSSFENALDLLAVSRVVFIRKSSSAMDLLTEARLERPFRAASRDLTRLYAGYYVAEILQSMTDDRDPHPDD